METRAQSGGGSPGPRGLSLGGGGPGPREALSQPGHVLSLGQIQRTGRTNEYTEGPVVAAAAVALQNHPETEPRVGEADQDRRGTSSRSGSGQSPRAHSLSGSSASTASGDSTHASEQRLLGAPPVDGMGEPKQAGLKPEELKPLAGRGWPGGHGHRCEVCGKCLCQECASSRAPPFCWACGGRCVCSAQSLVDYGTCVCCIKCLFYHCSSDDEDACADDPCSCGRPSCCLRWAAVGLLSLFLPCLLCYLPAKGCLALCQGCFDRAARPGCRCKCSDGKPT